MDQEVHGYQILLLIGFLLGLITEVFRGGE